MFFVTVMVLNSYFLFTFQDPLEQKTGTHPQRRVIQADDTADVEPGAAVVPRAAVMLFEKAAADIFSGQDRDGVNTAADSGGQLADHNIQWLDERGAAVDGKHPHGGLAEELVVILAQTLQGCKQNLDAPAGQSADKKIFRKHMI